MPRQEDSMARFDRVMHGLLAVPKDEALKTMAETIQKKKLKRKQARKRKKGSSHG